MAYYNVLFDQAVDELYPQWGFGERYVQETGCTTYVAEFHVCYLRELHVGDEVTCAIHIVDFDEKRFHLYCELFHKDGWLSATSEGLTLHVDQSGPKVDRSTQGSFKVTIENWVYGKVNGGGPEFMFNNMNGNIYIRKID